MAKFLTTSEVFSQIETIIKKAKANLHILSPYLKLHPTLSQRLQDADRRNIRIILIYGKEELEPDQKKLLSELKGLELYFCENLHAKCYFNEDLMVITSMNMHSFSVENNREMGVLITKEQDEEVFKAAVEEVHSILAASKKHEMTWLDKAWEQIPPPIKQWITKKNY